MKKLKTIIIALLSIISVGMLSGCFFEGEQTLEKMDVPEENMETTGVTESDEMPDSEDGEDGESEVEEESSQTVERELYLMDANGMIVPQSFELPASKEVATQALEYLVKDGPVTNLLPDGFQAVLPAGTEILGLNSTGDGTLVVDVSEEFRDYEPQEEEKILQAMTYTLTQFEGVERIKLWINGHEQTVMPVDGTPIHKGVSRADGINHYVGDNIDVLDSEAVTVYFPSQHDENTYHVPVTTRIKKGEDLYSSVVQALLDGPAIGSALLQPFNDQAEVLKTELNNGVLSVSFNEALLTGEDQPSLSDHALSSLVMSLTDFQEVEAVEVQVDGADQVVNEWGQPITEPVSRSDLQQAEEL
ncbi:spore gernimation protein [Halobacillus fulvus]|nr:spore gernimation protein [Halobacillus fulvus]